MEGINFNAVLLLTEEVPALGTVQSVCSALLLLPYVFCGFLRCVLPGHAAEVLMGPWSGSC